jgi:hypothetical protein
VALLRQALDVDPTNARAMVQLGRAQANLGKLDKAEVRGLAADRPLTPLHSEICTEGGPAAIVAGALPTGPLGERQLPFGSRGTRQALPVGEPVLSSHCLGILHCRSPLVLQTK